MNKYCMFKGKLHNAAPFKADYAGSPHYVINLTGADDTVFKIVVNSASTEVGEDGDNKVYFYADLQFVDPVTDKLDQLEYGLHTDDFPRLDYWQDRSLLDLHRMRPVPYQDEDGNRADVNDIISQALSIDTSQAPQPLPYDNGNGNPQDRDFFSPTDGDVTVYGFGFLFLPKQDGLHETHMNQGNPRGRHWKENGAFQDGAVIIKRGGGFIALFTAFQTQCLPTDAKGFPIADASPLPDFIKG
jgi:uncharacterized protein YukJ